MALPGRRPAVVIERVTQVQHRLQTKGARAIGPVRRTLLVLSLLAGVAYFASVVFPFYPPKHWLFFRYATYWCISVFWGAACVSCGDALVRRIHPYLPARERFVAACTAGFFTFAVGMFVFGLFGAYGKAFFVLFPSALLLAGGRDSPRFWRRYARKWSALRRKRSSSLLSVFVSALGLACVGMVYFNILVPANIAADSHWYHLPIAEHYVAEHGIRAFREGWYQGSLPHLASLVYAWAFMLPAGDIYDRIELSAHLEFVVFLWTLASVPVGVRWMVRRALSRSGRRVPQLHAAWVGVFLFPGIFLYDSSVTTAADHIAAFWAIPILLALGRALRSPTSKNGAWLGLPLAGAALTKYQSMALLAFPCAAFAVGALAYTVMQRKDATKRRLEPLRSLGAMALCAAVLTTPHWLKNFIWYGDPLYPFLYKRLHLHPWTVDSALLFEEVFKGQQLWTPKGTTLEMLKETAVATLNFSFEPHDWAGFHGAVPVFGSLFTLCLVPLSFLRRTQRTWLASGAALTGVFVWYWTSHQDRYLQLILPWMAVATVATVVLAWCESGIAVRAALVAWIGFQVVWGADVYFIPTHAVIGTTPAKAAIDLISTGYRKEYDARSANCNVFPKIAKRLPHGAKVLIHDSHEHLGIAAATVNDIGPWQGGLSYGRLTSPRAFYEAMRALGVTHFVFRKGINAGMDSYAGDFVFYDFVTRYAQKEAELDGYALISMPAAAPTDASWLEASATVMVCGGPYPHGLYRLADLRVPAFGNQPQSVPRLPLTEDAQANALFAQSTYVAFDPSCHGAVTSPARQGFERVVSRGTVELYVRAAPP
jgi:hypothetical protein